MSLNNSGRGKKEQNEKISWNKPKALVSVDRLANDLSYLVFKIL